MEILCFPGRNASANERRGLWRLHHHVRPSFAREADDRSLMHPFHAPGMHTAWDWARPLTLVRTTWTACARHCSTGWSRASFPPRRRCPNSFLLRFSVKHYLLVDGVIFSLDPTSWYRHKLATRSGVEAQKCVQQPHVFILECHSLRVKLEKKHEEERM